MADTVVPRYPVFIPSKGRHEKTKALTARRLDADGVPFRLVVEPQEENDYAEAFGPDRVMSLPFSNLGLGSIPARNWIKEQSTAVGDGRHWQLDDNIGEFRRLYRGKRIPCGAGLALRVCEDLSDRYTNVAVSGLNYQMFGINSAKPFVTNCHVYSCTLVNNEIPHLWRGRYNEDTDLCLQVLSDGWCTILVNAFLANKMRTMTMTGGNSDELYADDGRLRMARSLERVWPGVVSTERRFQRPQHVIRDAWRKFDTPLKLKDGVDLDAFPKVDEYGSKLVAVKAVRSEALRRAVGLD